MTKAEYDHEYYRLNKERKLQYSQNHYQANKEKIRAARRLAYSLDKDRQVARVCNWQRTNMDKVCASSSRRRAAVKNRTPVWANKEYVNLWYTFAKIEEERTGRKVHVDHIIPLHGEKVSGLHCEHNLQLLFAEDNMSKSNSYIVGQASKPPHTDTITPLRKSYNA